MTKLLSALFVTTLLLFGPAGCGTNDPDAQIKTIQELMDKDFPITEQQMSDIEKFVDEGMESIKAGDSDKAMAAFDEAIKILKFAEDAHLFNKSE